LQTIVTAEAEEPERTVAEAISALQPLSSHTPDDYAIMVSRKNVHTTGTVCEKKNAMYTVQSPELLSTAVCFYPRHTCHFRAEALGIAWRLDVSHKAIYFFLSFTYLPLRKTTIPHVKTGQVLANNLVFAF
jgi:hypothetical protein